MFVLAYLNEKKEIEASKVGSYAELRAEVEKGINEGSKYYKAVISKISGHSYILGEEKPKKRAKKA